MEVYDANVGFWIDEEPYMFEEGDSMETSKRLYLRETPQQTKLKGCAKGQSWAGNYFEVNDYDAVEEGDNIPTIVIGNGYRHDIVYRNGRVDYTYWLDKTPPKFEITKQLAPDQRSPLSLALSPFNDHEYEMSELICTQLKDPISDRVGWNDILELIKRCPPLSKCDPCTSIGYKIARSLIRIAALRIFAEPEQSIMELPVNSIDAYNPTSKIGKFGLGFFSILYWLVGHPKRHFIIDSFSKDLSGKYVTYRVIIQEVNGMLSFKLRMCPGSEITKTGTRMHLKTSEDPFSEENIEGFKKQLEKLKYVSNVRLYTNVQNIPDRSEGAYGYRIQPSNYDLNYTLPVKTSLRRWERSVFCFVNMKEIIVEDYATGIPPEITLGSLFIPSISTKTIKMSESAAGGKMEAVIYGSEPSSLDRLLILVSGISVVSILSKDRFGKDYMIRMPPNTRLPVSRDDIILTSENKADFQQAIFDLFEQTKNLYNDISSLQALLYRYSGYTSVLEIKEAIAGASFEFYQRYGNLLAPIKHRNLYTSLSRQFILSDIYYPSKIEGWMDANIKSDDTIWRGVKVVLVGPHDLGAGINFTSGSLLRYIFISKKYATGSKWMESVTNAYTDIKLIPVTSKLGSEEYKAYQADIFNVVIPDTFKQYLLLANGQNRLHYGEKVIVTPNIPMWLTGRAEDFITEPDVLLYFYSLVLKYDSLSIYFDDLAKYNRDFRMLLLQAYLFFGKSGFEKIANAYFNRFSEFKGNQTYGGSKYKVSLYNEYQHLYTNLTTKDYEFALENILVGIKAIKEEAYTKIEAVTLNCHVYYRDRFSIYGGQIPSTATIFFNETFRLSNNLLELTYLCASVGKAFLLSNATISQDLVTGYITSVLYKYRNNTLNTENALAQLYEIWNNNDGMNTSHTYVYMIKEKDRAAEWLSSVSAVNIVPQLTQVKTKKSATIQCNLSSLIRGLFSKVPTTDKELVATVEAAGKSKGITPLQIIEIATNEGTTKPFIEATLTELTQNSIDAMREANIKKDISVKVAEIVGMNKLVMTITDYVGMSKEAFLYVGIPFLSTKTPSELVTGEMGSGFFNVYRESSEVEIESHKDGTIRRWKDTPVRDDRGRVIDIVKEVSIEADPDKDNVTYIRIHISYKSNDDKVNKVSAIQYTVNKVLALANLPGNLLYQSSIPVNIPKIHITDVGKFQVYITDNRKYIHESYLLTKGVPFAPLTPYISQYVSRTIKDVIEQSLVVNIVHGGYTPVQTRTRITLPPEVEKDFVKVAVYCCFAMALMGMSNGTIHVVIDHEDSNASAEQLKFSNYDIMQSHTYTDFPSFIKYTSINGQPTVAQLINSCIDIMKDKKYEQVQKKIDDELAKYKSGSDWVDENVRKVVIKWLKPKNTRLQPTKSVEIKGKIIKDPSKVPDEPVTGKFAQLFTSWYEVYWDTWRDAKILKVTSKSMPSIKVVYSVKDRDKAGWYSGVNNTITINTYSIDDDDQEAVLKLMRIADLSDLQNTLVKPLSSNKLWTHYFAYQFPASTLPHEAEHFRRGTSHETGMHESSALPIFSGDTDNKTRSFDQRANEVYKRALEYGFLVSFVERYRKAPTKKKK